MGTILRPGDDFYSSPEDMIEILDLSANLMIYSDELQYPDNSDYVSHDSTTSTNQTNILNQENNILIEKFINEIKRLRILLYKHASHIPDIVKEKDELKQRASARKQKQLEKLLINN